MQSWLEQALSSRFQEWSYEETIKAKMLFLEYLGQGFAKREDEEGKRLIEHLESFGGEGQATLFAGTEMVPAPLAALGNGMLTDAPLVFPAVLAAVEQGNKGGPDLLAALIAGLEAGYRMGEHPQAELLDALVGVANAFELDLEGWEVLLGLVLHKGRTVPDAKLARGLLAQEIVVAGGLAREEWSRAAVSPQTLPADWMEALQRTADKPGMTSFLMAAEVNADLMISDFRELAEGNLPAHFIEYYVDAVMGLEDICCIPLFFRR